MFKNLIKNLVKNEIKEEFKRIVEEHKEEDKNDYVFHREQEEPDFNLSIKRTSKDMKRLDNNGIAMDGMEDTGDNNLNEAFNVNAEDTLNGTVFNHFAKQGFIGYQACAVLSQNWLINKCCTVPNDDAVRVDYEVSYTKPVDDEEKANVLTEIKVDADDTKQFDIKGFCRKFGINKRVFGYALCIPIVEGANMEEEFNIDNIKKGSYKGMSVVDPYWITPQFDNASQSNPTSKDFYVPTWYQMPDGQLIHKSWFIWNTYGEVPDILKPTYYFGGFPLTQLLYERVYTTEKVANEAYMLTMSKRLLVMDGNMNAFLLNQNKLQQQAKGLAYFRDNWGTIIKDRESTIQQIDTSLADFDAVLMSQLQLCCSIADIPTTKLLNTQPKGFNTTGEYEMKQYNTLLAQIQEQDFIPIIKKHFQLQMKSKYNMVEDFTVKFKPIDVPTEKEQAEINNLKADYYSKLSDLGAVDGSEIRDRLIKDPASSFNDLQDSSEEDIEENEEFNLEENIEENVKR